MKKKRPYHHYEAQLLAEFSGEYENLSTQMMNFFANKPRLPFQPAPQGGFQLARPTLRNGEKADPNSGGLGACMYEYRRAGKQCFILGPEMQQAFQDTDLDNVPNEALQAPFPAYYIALPGNTDLKIYTGSAEKRTPFYKVSEDGGITEGLGPHWNLGDCPVQGVYVIWRDGNIHIQAVSNLGNAEAARKNADMGYMGNPTLSSSWFSFSFPTEAETDTLEERLGEILGNWKNNLGDMHVAGPAHGRRVTQKMPTAPPASYLERETKNAEAMLKILRLVINATLYINSANADLKQHTTRDPALPGQVSTAIKDAAAASGRAGRKARRKADRLYSKLIANKSVVYIGPTIEQRAGRARAAGARKGGLRRGHWHNYRIGAMKRADGTHIPAHERKLLLHWVAPTWVTGDGSVHEGGREYHVK